LRNSRARVACDFLRGTGLLQSFLSKLGEAPSANPELRAKLEAMRLRIVAVNSANAIRRAYEKIDKPKIRAGVIRAVEVIRDGAKSFPNSGRNWNQKPEVRSQEKLFRLSRQPDDCTKRIDVRVDAMFARGLVMRHTNCSRRG